MTQMKKIILILTSIIILTSCNDDDWEFGFIGNFKNYHSFAGIINSNDNSSVLDKDENIIICGNNYDLISILKVSKKEKNSGEKIIRYGIAQSRMQLFNHLMATYLFAVKLHQIIPTPGVMYLS